MAVILHYFVILTGLVTICEGQRHGSFEGQYRGCYNERSDRALESIAYFDIFGINSNGRCIRNCGFLGFTFAGTVVLPAVGGSMFDGIKVFCIKEWQKKGIKKFTVTFNNEELSERAEYVNQQSGISVQTTDNELTNKVIINLRQNLIPFGRSPKCAIMCKDGTQFSGFFISVSCTLDMVDEGNKMDSLYGLHKFKTVRPDFAPSEEQHLQLSHLAKDYISHGQKNN
ncbi:hypothetical protein CAPTEDRAFT_214247 [Capitella teleta]|uniref:Uncharacterized protein n=1 Tax=Capitella teleta TaxID=283909 RepID=R7VB73_CAPTE|nr:hypothetical protein CAPTEDRAFT_214247 [Capitella teleta]|eukprot:ELU12955.1 hypothetical protein CAPTEDRAFT_214247 [Capitella teleta]